MKITIVTLLFLFCAMSASFAIKTVGTYSLSYFDKEYSIEASEIKNDKFTVYLGVSGAKETRTTMIGVESKNIEAFVQFLTQMKEKFVEWSDVAKENNVKDMSKDMDFKSPSTTICWYGSDWFFSFDQKLEPTFKIRDNGEKIAFIYKKVTASSNQYIDESIYWVFSTPEEFDALIEQLNVEKIMAKLQNTQKASDIFK